MSLIEADARQIRSQLETVLESRDLQWLVEQANERISLGKTVTKRVQTSDVVLFDEIDSVQEAGTSQRRDRRPSETFLASEPFTENEKLQIVLDAIGYVLVSLSKMQLGVREILDRAGSVSIEFRGDSAEGASHRVGDEYYDSAELTTNIENVLRRLRELKDADPAAVIE